MHPELKIIPVSLLEVYLLQIPHNLSEAFNALHDAEISTDTFSFYTSVASVYSSKIEGEEIELDSYIRHKRFGAAFLPDYTKKTDDLYDAYTFAKYNVLNKENIAKAHVLLSKHILAKHQRGKFRTQNMYISTPEGNIEYVAASPFVVDQEMQKLYEDIDLLIKEALTIEQVFFYAAIIHLVFVKIHPWMDGNGRSARLIEKWFLAQKLGHKAWFIQSEKYYYGLHQTYYNNLRLLGLEYQYLDCLKALPFLLMLPASIGVKS
jgi:Fic family protein